MDQNREPLVPERILHYFPLISEIQKERFSRLEGIYRNWNQMINVISRKDMDNFIEHHVLHSLAIAMVFRFQAGSSIIDVGTGGGFPGIPLAILFPEVKFTLIDSIWKKIKVVIAAAEELGLNNVRPVHGRVEDEKSKYEYVISRAVTNFPAFAAMTSKNIILRKGKTGIIYLKGGDLTSELADYKDKVKVWNISEFYSEPFFETKKIVYLPF